MQIRDRIVELRRVRASELKPHPRNWRTHPRAQREALQSVLRDVGYADALLVRETEEGSLQLIDGHLRAEMTPDQQVPVLVLDLSEEEAEKLLTVFDPLAALAESNDAVLRDLLERVETENAAMQTLLDAVACKHLSNDDAASTPPEAIIPELYQVVVECRDEEEQRAVYDQMTADGHTCRLLNM